MVTHKVWKAMTRPDQSKPASGIPVLSDTGVLSVLLSLLFILINMLRSGNGKIQSHQPPARIGASAGIASQHRRYWRAGSSKPGMTMSSGMNPWSQQSLQNYDGLPLYASLINLYSSKVQSLFVSFIWIRLVKVFYCSQSAWIPDWAEIFHSQRMWISVLAATQGLVKRDCSVWNPDLQPKHRSTFACGSSIVDSTARIGWFVMFVCSAIPFYGWTYILMMAHGRNLIEMMEICSEETNCCDDGVEFSVW